MIKRNKKYEKNRKYYKKVAKVIKKIAPKNNTKSQSVIKIVTKSNKNSNKKV